MPRLYRLGLDETICPFECDRCTERFFTIAELESHECYYQFQCDVCQKRFGTDELVKSGEHRFRRRDGIANCNDYFVFITNTGKRVVKNKKTDFNLNENRKRKREETEIKRMLKSQQWDEIPVIDISDEISGDEMTIIVID